ncbi:unnamed protein product [Protopolystoma xenopodis]|uniref:Uncharacterized protein n=1 Tax=Protopolystoma xenopodis TaxID=117903 RepID=A0A448WY02_9PLAT|nr:unnamed protein product [Protopolystoma xenopodis]
MLARTSPELGRCLHLLFGPEYCSNVLAQYQAALVSSGALVQLGTVSTGAVVVSTSGSLVSPVCQLQPLSTFASSQAQPPPPPPTPPPIGAPSSTSSPGSSLTQLPVLLPPPPCSSSSVAGATAQIDPAACSQNAFVSSLHLSKRSTTPPLASPGSPSNGKALEISSQGHPVDPRLSRFSSPVTSLPSSTLPSALSPLPLDGLSLPGDFYSAQASALRRTDDPASLIQTNHLESPLCNAFVSNHSTGTVGPPHSSNPQSLSFIAGSPTPLSSANDLTAALTTSSAIASSGGSGLSASLVGPLSPASPGAFLTGHPDEVPPLAADELNTLFMPIPNQASEVVKSR